MNTWGIFFSFSVEWKRFFCSIITINYNSLKFPALYILPFIIIFFFSKTIVVAAFGWQSLIALSRGIFFGQRESENKLKTFFQLCRNTCVLFIVMIWLSHIIILYQAFEYICVLLSRACHLSYYEGERTEK